MNKAFIIGNLTKDPESRTTQTGIKVCNFTVAVNRRHRDGVADQADFFKVSAWRQLGEICEKYLSKGKKVAVTGPVSVSTYQAQDGSTRASLDVMAEDVEFLSPKNGEQASGQAQTAPEGAKPDGTFVEVEGSELPF